MSPVADVGSLEDVMRSRERPGRERALVALAVRQHGVVAHRQLRELGFRPRAIQHRVAAQRLHGVHTGVYAVGRPELELRGRWMAAVLAAGPGAVLSHGDAAALLELRQAGAGAVHVTGRRSRRGGRGIRVHRVRHLRPEDTTTVERIPVTSVARTLLDLAEVLQPRQLERAFEQAERLRVLDLRAVERVCTRSHGRRGLRALRDLLAEEQIAAALHTRSELERRFLDLCRDNALPIPALNVSVAGFEVDAFWPQARLVVELDGYSFHRSRESFERDRARDAALQVAGCRVVRVTQMRIAREPGRIAQDLRALLGGLV